MPEAIMQQTGAPGALPPDLLQVKCRGGKALFPLRVHVNEVTLGLLANLRMAQTCSEWGTDTQASHA
jgi:hypothetical protein